MLIKPDAPKPKVVGVRVWPRAIPQFNLGHLEQLDKAKSALARAGWDNFLLSGNYVSGGAGHLGTQGNSLSMAWAGREDADWSFGPCGPAATTQHSIICMSCRHGSHLQSAHMLAAPHTLALLHRRCAGQVR